MRRLFWFGLGATVGAAATRKYAQLREQLTWQVLLKSLASSVPVLLSSLRSIVVNAVRALQAAQSQNSQNRNLQSLQNQNQNPNQKAAGTKP
jgi:hypothetical protein